MGMFGDGCPSGVEALEKLQSDHYSLVILDLIMPVMGGIETLREIKNRGIEVKTIVISGFATDALVAQCQSFGSSILEKPISMSELSEIIKKL